MPDWLSSPTSLRSMLTSVPPARWRTAFVAFLAVVVAFSAVRYWNKATKPSRDNTLTRTAILRWQNQVNNLANGVNVYKPNPNPINPELAVHDPYPNPPIQGLILWPMYHLPGDEHALGGAMLWFALKVGMAIGILLWAFRLCGPMPGWARVVAVVLAAHPILGDLSHGNVNIFIGFLVLGALELYRRRYDIPAGLVLALAIACKLTPALFLPYLVWKRAWKMVAASLVGLGVWWFVVPGVAVGWQHNLTLLESWYDGMVRPFVVEGKVTSQHANQSIPGIVFRLLTRGPSAIEYDEEDGRPVPAAFHNVAEIGPDTAWLMVRICQGAFVAAVVLLCRSRSRQGLWFAAECGLIVLGMLLFSERTWKHHGVMLALPYAVLAAFVATRPRGPGLRGYGIGTLVLSGLLTIGPGALPEQGQDLALTYGTHTAAFLLLTAAMCVVVVYEKRAASPLTSTSDPD